MPAPTKHNPPRSKPFEGYLSLPAQSRHRAAPTGDSLPPTVDC